MTFNLHFVTSMPYLTFIPHHGQLCMRIVQTIHSKQDKFYRNFGLLTFFPLDVEPNDIYNLRGTTSNLWKINCLNNIFNVVEPLGSLNEIFPMNDFNFRCQ